MKPMAFLRLIRITLVLLAFTALAGAQDSVKCESNDGRRNYCGQYGDQVLLERQISGSPCVEGQTWGVDRTGLWVDRGCRAYFTVRGNSRVAVGGQDSVKCESNDGRRNYCGQYGDQVRLERQISGSPCIEGQTWGVDRTGLWVDRGCRAIFTVRGYVQGGGLPGESNSPWWNRDPSDTWPPRGDWHGGNWGSGGACFYKDRGFGGSYFCMRRGEQRDSLAGYGDQISSIRVFGGARVFVFDDRNFSGARTRLRQDAPDLERVPVSQKPGHTWNNRISSVRVQ
jgi:DUF3011 family protein